jgi:predicted DsbA family dithiol-disulfide isomerase
MTRMQVEIWSDVVCPFCYIGTRQLEAALRQLPHRERVQVT